MLFDPGLRGAKRPFQNYRCLINRQLCYVHSADGPHKPVDHARIVDQFDFDIRPSETCRIGVSLVFKRIEASGLD